MERYLASFMLLFLF